MSFWMKLKAGIQRFMIGRNGVDELSFALLILALIASLLSSIFGSAILSLISTVAYVFCIYRMLSRNVAKRRMENSKYVEMSSKIRVSASQAFVRLKNTKKYKYFKCPECKSLLRLPRKVGEVTVTCGKCKHAFKMKA